MEETASTPREQIQALLTEKEFRDWVISGVIRVTRVAPRTDWWIEHGLIRGRCIGVIGHRQFAGQRQPYWYSNGSREEVDVQTLALLLALRADEEWVQRTAG